MSVRTFVIALLFSIIALPAVSDGKPTVDPDFAWASSCSTEVKAALDRAKADWQAASMVLPKDEKLPQQRFDELYLRELMNRPNWGAASCDLLDTAFSRKKSLDSCKAEYLNAVALACASAPDTASAFDVPYYLLRSRIKLAMGISRAAISLYMTKTENSNYCFEAMESAIDALRDSADDSDRVPGGAKRAESIRKFRSILFEIWERAQRSKDTKPIGEIDLAKVFDQSNLLGACHTQSRL